MLLLLSTAVLFPVAFSYTTFRILRQKSSNILCNLRKDTFQSLKKTIVAAIMATDMISHFAEVRRAIGRRGLLAGCEGGIIAVGMPNDKGRDGAPIAHSS